jgi:hypothetical protein
MTRSSRLAATCTLAAVAACHQQAPTVALRGAPGEIAALAGRWEGEYGSGQSGRSGAISFTITARGDSAFGDVLMMPAGGQRIVAADADTRGHASHASGPEVLHIDFVQVASGGSVEGALEPYIAPDCRCIVTTVFRGIVRGNAISGEFVTRGDAALRQTGSWSVRRK